MNLPVAPDAGEEDPTLDAADSPATETAEGEPAPAPADPNRPNAPEGGTGGTEESEAAKIARFEEMIKWPAIFSDIEKQFQMDRDYVAKTCMVQDDEDTVATNYILRNQFTLISNVYAREPAIAVNPKKWMGDYPPGLFEFGRTVELMTMRISQEADFKRVLTGMLQDVQTTGIAWMKVGVQQDISRDPLGCRRHDDQLDNIARLGTMLQQFQEGCFDETSDEYQDLVDLSDTVRGYLRGQIQDKMTMNPPAQVPAMGPDGQPMPAMDDAMGFGQPTQADPMDPNVQAMGGLGEQGQPMPPSALPEVPNFIGFNLDPVQPEDIRFDWAITRPEDFYNAKWVAHRVYYTKADIDDRWDINEEDWTFAGKAKVSYGSKANSKNIDTDPADRTDNDATQINDRYAVWEMHEKMTGRRYVWCEGMRKFFVNEVPEVVWHKWYPFFPLIFNRVTGRFFGLSDVQLQRPLQEEINTKRTHEREAQKACYPRYVIQAGLLDAVEKQKLETAQPYAVVEVKAVEELQKKLIELKVATFDPALYDITKPQREIQLMAGIPAAANGATGGADTLATEAAIANEQLGIQSDRRKDIVESLIHDVHECLVELELQIFPEDNVKQICGPAAVWPVLDRDKLWRNLGLEIKAGMAGRPDKKKELEAWTQFGSLAATLPGVVVNGPAVFEKILEVMELPVDLSRFMVDPRLVMQAQQMGIPIPGVQGPKTGGAAGPGGPAQGAGAGGPPQPGAGSQPGGQPGAGAPPMNDRSAPGPANVPNKPNI